MREDCIGRTALHLAASHGHTEAVKVLLKAESNPLLKDEDGETPKDSAELDSIKALLQEAEETHLRMLLKPSTKVDGVEKPPVLMDEHQEAAL